MTASVLGKKRERLVPQGMGGFLLVWVGQVASLLSSGMVCFAQSIWVYTKTGSVTHLAMLALCSALPGLLISPLAGALVDRWDRRWVLVVSDSVAAAATLILRALIVTGRWELWHIYVITTILSIASHFQWPAYFATIPMMVPKNQLGYANGLVQLGRSLGQIAAPFMAGMLVTVFKLSGIILFDFATYVFAMAMLLIVRIPRPTPSEVGLAGRGTLVREAIYGWKYILDRPGLISLLIFFSVSNFLLGVVGVLVTPLALSITTTAVLGSAMSVGGVGMLLGSVVISAWGGPKRRVYGVLGFMLLEGLAVTLGGLQPSVLLIAGAYVLFCFSAPIVNACSQAIWQVKVAPDMQGRVLAASGIVISATPPVATLIAGPLADRVFEPLLAVNGALAGTVGRVVGVGPGRGIGFMFVLFGALCLLATIAGFLYPHMRRLDEELPDAIPDQPPAPDKVTVAFFEDDEEEN